MHVSYEVIWDIFIPDSSIGFYLVVIAIYSGQVTASEGSRMQTKWIIQKYEEDIG
jgi:hypothetical protein